MLLSDSCTISGVGGVAKAYAKVNLTLDVTGKRADGYHNILSVMRTVDIYDTVTAELISEPEILLTTSKALLPTDEKNIAYKAACYFFEAAKAAGGVKLHITKNIPCGAGMGGGSADGAAVLLLLNKLFGNPLTEEKLLQIGSKIGADVPFCMMGKAAVASGIGDILTPVKTKGTVPILVVKPEVSISTPEMYKIIDEYKITKRPDTAAMCDAIESGDILKISENLYNVMEAPAVLKHSVIGEIRDTMCANGALGAVMTGSGSAVFGIFATQVEADLCKKNFDGKFCDVFSTILL